MYKYDAHIHTSQVSPCGKVDGAEVARLYKKAGFDGVVITDHYTENYFNSFAEGKWEEKIDCFLEGYRNALEEGQRIGINVLLGMEILFTENYNDYLIYGIDEGFLYNNRELYKYGLKSFRQLIEGTPAMIYQAHPFRSWLTPANPCLLDGVEVFNGNPRQNSNNNKALDFAVTNSLRMISGSDFHQKLDVAIGGIELPCAPADSIEFSRLLKENRNIRLLP